MSGTKRKADDLVEDIEINWVERIPVSSALSTLSNQVGVYLITNNYVPIYVGVAKWGFLRRWMTRLEVFRHAHAMSVLDGYYVHCGHCNSPSEAAAAESLLTHILESNGYTLFNRTNRKSHATYSEFTLSHTGILPKVLTGNPPAPIRGLQLTREIVGEQVFGDSTVDGRPATYTITLNWQQVNAVNDIAEGLPDKIGLYAIVNRQDSTFYIGKAESETIAKRWTGRLAGVPNFGMTVRQVFTNKQVQLYCAVFKHQTKREQSATSIAEVILINHIFKHHNANTTNTSHPPITAKEVGCAVVNLNLDRFAPLKAYLPASARGEDY